MTIKGLLIDVKSDPGMVRDVDFDEDILEEMYDLVQCNLIDIVTRPIGGKEYSIVCDDEGLFDEHPYISAVNDSNKPMLVGNLLICNSDNSGHLTSLSEDDIKHICQYIHIGVDLAREVGKIAHVFPTVMIC